MLGRLITSDILLYDSLQVEMNGQPRMRILVLAEYVPPSLEVIPFSSPLSLRHGDGALPYLSDRYIGLCKWFTNLSIFSPTSNAGPCFRFSMTVTMYTSTLSFLKSLHYSLGRMISYENCCATFREPISIPFAIYFLHVLRS